MKRNLYFLALPILFIVRVTTCVAEEVSYGQKFIYEPPRAVQFRDFTLQFVNKRAGAFYPGSTTRRLGDVYEFRITDASGSQTVEWSAGTGDIGPTIFSVGEGCFWLELHSSDKIGVLKQSEAVVLPDPKKGESCKQKR